MERIHRDGGAFSFRESLTDRRARRGRPFPCRPRGERPFVWHDCHGASAHRIDRRRPALNSDVTFPHDYRVVAGSALRPTIVGGQAVHLWAITFLEAGDATKISTRYGSGD